MMIYKEDVRFSFDEYGCPRRMKHELRARRDGLKNYSYAAIAADPYGVQGVIMREIGMDENSVPDFSYDSDRLLSLEYDGFRQLCKEAFDSGENSIGQWSLGTGKKNLLRFAEQITLLIDKQERKATGVRIIRNTNINTGQPIYTIQAIFKKEKQS